jgi:hypothetical protein
VVWSFLQQRQRIGGLFRFENRERCRERRLHRACGEQCTVDINGTDECLILDAQFENSVRQNKRERNFIRRFVLARGELNEAVIFAELKRDCPGRSGRRQSYVDCCVALLACGHDCDQ